MSQYIKFETNSCSILILSEAKSKLHGFIVALVQNYVQSVSTAEIKNRRTEWCKSKESK